MPWFKTAMIAMLAMPAIDAAADNPGQPSADPNAFLERLAGEWSVVSEATLGPGQPPVRNESRESARLLGGKWLVAEITRSVRDRTHSSILTLGHDDHQGHFIATYIDSMQRHMWSYTGTLDDTGTVLTLNTEGPILGDPSKVAKYRVIIESRADDFKLMRSKIFGPDGQWFEFSRTEYRRTDPP
jgi:hypothetical protein